MSRGGRGGFRGGGGGGGYGRGKIGGVDVPWEYDPELKVETKPSELFPQIPPPIAKPPRRIERIQVAHYRALRERIHEGPLYTVLGDNVRVGKATSAPSAHATLSATAAFDPFEGMPTYTQKYRRQRRRIPRLDTRPYVKKFFPEELWTTLDPSQAGKAAAKPKKKMLQIAHSNRLRKLDEWEDTDAAAGDVEDVEKDPEDEENEAEEEEQDDEFEEDDEDDDDDYNAEQYFENGEDDDYGDEGGGGGDEYGDF